MQRSANSLQPGSGDVVLIDAALMGKASAAALESPRLRMILPFHHSESDSLQRMLNALQLHTYIRPHWHHDPPKSESIVVIRGAIKYITFDTEGNTTGVHRLSALGDPIGVDTQPGVIHTFLALEADTVVFEVKPGPYSAVNDKQFVPWAPAEDAPEAKSYLAYLESL